MSTYRAGATWGFSTALVKIVVKILSLAVLSRILTPEDFGAFAIVTMLTGFADLFATQGATTTLLHRADINPRHVGSSFLLSAVIAAVYSLAVLCLIDEVGAFFKYEGIEGIVPWSLIIVWTQMLGHVPVRLLLRDRKFRHVSLIELAAFVVGESLLSIGLALSGFGVLSLVAGALFGQACVLVFSLFAAHRQLAFTIGWAELKETVSDGRLNTFTAILSWTSRKVDQVLIGRFFGVNGLGGYNRALSLQELFVSLLNTPINRVLSVAGADMKHADRQWKMACLRATQLNLLIALPAAALMCSCAELVVRLLLGAKWLPYTQLFQICSLAMPLRLQHKLVSALLLGANRQRQVYVSVALYLVMLTAGLLVMGGRSLELSVTLVLGCLFVQTLVTCYSASRAYDFRPAEFLPVLYPGVKVAIAMLVPVQGALLISEGLGLETYQVALICTAAALVSALVIWFVLAEKLLGTKVIDEINNFMPKYLRR